MPVGTPRWPPSWKSIFRFFYCTKMPVASKVGRRYWGWLVLLVTSWKFQHFNLVSKIFQKLFKPLPCHKSIEKECCMPSAYLQWRFHSGERVVARGPLVHISAQNIDCIELPQWGSSNEYPQSIFLATVRKIMYTPLNPKFYYIKVGFKEVKII